VIRGSSGIGYSFYFEKLTAECAENGGRVALSKSEERIETTFDAFLPVGLDTAEERRLLDQR
jgi:hypothetical protein